MMLLSLQEFLLILPDYYSHADRDWAGVGALKPPHENSWRDPASELIATTLNQPMGS